MLNVEAHKGLRTIALITSFEKAVANNQNAIMIHTNNEGYNFGHICSSIQSHSNSGNKLFLIKKTLKNCES